MPFEAALFVTVVAVAFGGYAALLGWGLWYTNRA